MTSSAGIYDGLQNSIYAVGKHQLGQNLQFPVFLVGGSKRPTFSQVRLDYLTKATRVLARQIS